nr:hypothetical protein [Tanacetum cinerariifolium]
VDSGATHNFVAVDEAERLGINATKGSGIKAGRFEAMANETEKIGASGSVVDE